MKFGLLHTYRLTAEIAEATDLAHALRLVGIAPGMVDHGTISRELSIVVAEFGLFVAPEHQGYFTIEGYRHLCAGTAVLYATNERGEAVDLKQLPAITWLPDRRAVERAIAEGIVRRPHIGVGDDVIWRWPGPRPSEAERERLMSKLPSAGSALIDDTWIILRPPEEEPK